MNCLEEAIELGARVNKALQAMNHCDGFSGKIKESEVKIRYDAVVGMLLMARNDIAEMTKEWRTEAHDGDAD